jgi:cytochrome c biogenesis protein
LTFTGYQQWVSLAITYDPGTVPALLAGIAALAGLLLSFFVRRRRMFVRAYPGADGGTVVDVAGLVRTDAGGGFEEEFAGLAEALRSAHDGHGVVTDPGPPGEADSVPAGPAAGNPSPAGPAAGNPSPTDTEGE